MEAVRGENYIEEDDLESIEEISKKTCNGFCIIFDITDSTKRKEEYKYHSKWVEHTAVLYKAFDRLNNDLKKKELSLVVQKFNGDGVMSFLKDSESISTSLNEVVAQSICQHVIESVIKFKNEVQSTSKLCAIKLKTVVAYLTDVHLVSISEGNNDVLGKGIDFAFRLEAFSDIGYITLNNFLYKNLFSDKSSIKINKTDYFAIEIEKIIKGWNTPQKFHVITNKDMIEESILDLRPDKSEKKLTDFIFKFYQGIILQDGKNKFESLGDDDEEKSE